MAALPSDNQVTRDPEWVLQKLAEDLHARGWSILEDWLPPGLVPGLRSELLTLHKEGHFHKAAIGRASTFQNRPDIRGDFIAWLNPESCSHYQQEFFRVLKGLRVLLGRKLLLPLREVEAHFAIYPPGTGYQKHLDQFRDSSQRALTFVLYLNEDWKESDGGLLRLFGEHDSETLEVSIVPRAGTAAFFLSGNIYHEVTATNRTRYSLTGWLRD